MYKFVHDHIQFTPTWGEVKGPYMTWMDRSGNGFDQAGLMIALLEEAADPNNDSEYTITNLKFVVGEIELTASQFRSWFGLSEGAMYGVAEADVAEQLLARNGLYGTVARSGDNIVTVNLEHVWVTVTINGNDYEFDPSFKSHEVETALVELREKMGYLQGSYLLEDVDDGMTEGYSPAHYIEDLNTTNMADYLKEATATLAEALKDDYSDADLKDIVGGNRIEPVEESTMPPVSLSYTVDSRDDEFSFDAIPDMYRTTLRIQHSGLDETFFSSDIYGRRLTLQYNGSNQPQFVLDGTVEATGSATTPGQAYDLVFTVDHPYNATVFDQSTTISVVSGGFYQIVNGWANTGTPILRKHRDLLEEHIYDTGTTEEVQGQSYALVGLTWLAQTSHVRSMAAGIGKSIVVNHHQIGITGQSTSGGAPYIDIPLGCLGVTSYMDSDSDRKGAFMAIVGHASAYEHQVIRQLQDCNAVSTVKLFDMANEDGTYDKIYRATTASWNNVQTGLTGYSQAELDQVEDYLDDGFEVYLPENGNLTDGDWTGTGFHAVLIDANVMAASYIISGGYSGGAATAEASLDSDKVFENCYGSEDGRSGDGAYGLSNTDLSIGSGDYPFGLSFSRQYSTRRRLEDGPLGLGWTHSLDIQAMVRSDGFQFLGVDSPVDAAPMIVNLYAAFDLLRPGSTLFYGVTASLCESWLMDHIIDKTIVVKQGSGTTTFTLDPNDSSGTTYTVMPSRNLKLVVQGNGNFRIKNTSGCFQDFNSDNRISQWSDPHGNHVNFIYTSGKLTGVTSDVNGVTCRSLTLSYTGDHITSVTDSAGRSVSYAYTGDELTAFTNLDNNDVTYEYNDVRDGLMEEIYSPIDAYNPILTIAYDSLDRMKSQTDANDTTWDYYRANYRSEVVGPAQIDPSDPNAISTRYSTITWGNPQNKTTISTDQMGRETISQYDGTGKTVSILSASGMTTEYEYDPNTGKAERIDSLCIAGSDDPNTTTSGTYASFEDPITGRWFVWNDKSTNELGKDTIYTYDFDDPNYSPKKGLLLKITYPDANTVDGAMTPVEIFTYYYDGRIETETNKEGIVTYYEYYDLTTAPNQGGLDRKIVVDYNDMDPNDNLNLTTQYTYDSVGRQTTVTDARGNTTQYEYFNSGLTRRTISASPFNYETVNEYYDDGKLKHTKTYTGGQWIYLQSITYNARGQKATVRGPYPEDPNAAELQINYTQYHYDALGRQWKMTDAENHVTETLYYPDGQLYKVIDAEGNAQITYVYNEDGSLKEKLDANGHKTEYEYSGFMGLESVTYEDETSATTEYDKHRRVETETTRSGDTIIYTYYDDGQVASKTVGDNTITYQYDIMGRTIITTDDTGTTVTSHDNLGRITGVNYPGGKVVSYEYDAVGNRTKLTYPDASYITYTYDQLSRLTEVRNDVNTVLAEYTYDDLSRRTALDYANGTGISYQYDVAGRLLDINNVTETGPLAYAYTYDDIGNRMSMSVTDSTGTSIHVYDYDNIYQVTDVNYPESLGYLATDTTFNYDGVGNRTSVVNDNGTTGYTTNELNQYTDVGGVDCFYDRAGNMVNDGNHDYLYDAENRLVMVLNTPDVLAAACDTTLAFTTGGDANWAPTGDTYNYGFDSVVSGDIDDSEECWIQTVVHGKGTIKFSWKASCDGSDSINFFIDGQYIGGHAGTFGWDDYWCTINEGGAHILRWKYSKGSSGSLGEDCAWVDQVEWTPSPRVSVSTLEDALDISLSITTGGDNTFIRTTYPTYYGNDSARRGYISDGQRSWMDAQVYGAGTVTFYWKVSSEQNYDELRFYIDGVLQDEISGEVDWTQKSYNIDGESLHTLMWEYEKDSSGSDGSDCGWVDYLTWSGDTQPSWEIVEYVYDPAGRRIEKKYDGATQVKYVYDGDQCIAEYDGSDNLLRKFIYGPGIDQPICMIDVQDSNAVSYYHYDGLGSVVALSDGDGDMVQAYEYDVYGNVAASDPNHTSPFMFTGRRLDIETGLYFYRARYYNPALGRFLQTDPIGYGDGMNMYAYCGNNPIGATDPSGLAGGDISYRLTGQVAVMKGGTVVAKWDTTGIGQLVTEGMDAVVQEIVLNWLNTVSNRAAIAGNIVSTILAINQNLTVNMTYNAFVEIQECCAYDPDKGEEQWFPPYWVRLTAVTPLGGYRHSTWIPGSGYSSLHAAVGALDQVRGLMKDDSNSMDVFDGYMHQQYGSMGDPWEKVGWLTARKLRKHANNSQSIADELRQFVLNKVQDQLPRTGGDAD